MDSGAKPQKTIEDAVKNLKIDPSSKADTTLTGLKDGSPSDATSCISSGDATTSSIKESELDQEALMVDQGMYYYGYCYPGFNSSCGEWDDQGYYLATDNMEVQPQVIQGDNGTLMYYFPGYSPGYTPYSPILPGAVVGAEGQYLGQQSYYPSPVLQQPLASPGFVPQSVAYGPELVPAYPWDSSFLFADGFQGYGLGGYPPTPTPQSSFSSWSHTLPSSKSSTSSKSTSSETKGSSLASDVTPTPAGPKPSIKPLNINKGAAAVYSKGYLPINKFPPYANQGKGGLLHPNGHINIKNNGRSWAGSEKVKASNKLNGPGEIDLLNEQNRGPRTNSIKNASISGVDLVGSLDAGKNDNSNNSVATVRKDMYNLSDFPTKYDHALFFVIKSYSEDDVHKSIKYNVWASTPNGNKRLDNAFQVAQEKMAENSSRCPVFLFFSVNASGQFCGVAEMMGPVDFNKNMDFWQQDKWNGFFPVKWHIIKDIPNPQFRHIILENNENKPVTNSRDTQEVKFSQGTEMLNIFKNYSSKTSILDDFNFYESRQKAMQHKRSKPPPLRFDHLQPKADELSALKPGDLKFIVSTLQSVELEAVKAKDELSTMVAATE